LTRDLSAAGAGPLVGGEARPLAGVVPVVLPFRRGANRNDPPETIRSDAISAIAVPATAAQTTLAAELPAGATALSLKPTVGCETSVNLCGFVPGLSLIAYDPAGAFDIFVVSSVDAATSVVNVAVNGSSSAYPSGAPVVEARVRTYYLKQDPVAQNSQLMQADGTSNPDVPVLDHVVDLRFEYFATANSRLDPSEFRDGPWLPDAVSPSRWDADLLRIRTVGVTLRVEGALAALRGPAGALFRNGGVATSPRLWVPDQEITFAVFPRSGGESR
ncbi:MAG TPA: hypothetical protein VKD69_16420, partial [Vicinamibacterales bacterium]|nr:hypothetical protein [Vicinamibacterales bacterium]